MRKRKRQSSWLPFNNLLGGQKYRYWTSVVYLAVNSVVLNLLSGALYRSVIQLIEGRSLRQAWLDLILLMLCVMGLSVLTFYAERGLQDSSSHADRNFRSGLVAHVIRLTIPCWDLRGKSYYLNLLGRDITNYSSAYRRICPFFFRMLLAAILGFFIVFSVNWRLAAFSLGSGIVYFMTAHLIKKTLRKTQERRQEALQSSTLIVQELLEGFSKVKFYDREKSFQSALSASQKEFVKASKRHASIRTLEVGLSSFGYAFAYVGSLAYALYLVNQGAWDLSTAMFIWPAAMQMSYAIQKMGGLLLDYQEPRVSLTRLEETMSLPSEITNNSHTRLDHVCECFLAVDTEPELELKNVSFAYPGSSMDEAALVLKDVSFKIQAGERIAIQGESGSGKSILFKLLLGFYHPTSGMIKWKGIDLATLSLDERRLIFSYLPQFPQLYRGSLEENLLLVEPNSSKEDLKNATNRAQTHHFEGRVEEFLQTEVGFGGDKVSGGERQRIGLARAYLKSAPVMLLDEVTSALDASLEDKVMDAIAEHRSHTFLYITHREQSAKWADKIITLDKGRIVDNSNPPLT